ncbi:hypothetical protein MTBSS4_30138 [Magnetospirillum sp. SS-4]|nr:hypothetical protein MTBSS4_30138 [Magnetospirillum sp. SS-4]
MQSIMDELQPPVSRLYFDRTDFYGKFTFIRPWIESI